MLRITFVIIRAITQEKKRNEMPPARGMKHPAKIKCTQRKIVHRPKFIPYRIKTNVGEKWERETPFLNLYAWAYRGRVENIFFPIVKLARDGSRTRYENHLLKEIRAKLNFSSRRPSFNDNNRKDEDCRESYICIL